MTSDEVCFVDVLARAGVGNPGTLAHELLRRGRSHCRLHEAACNGELTPAQEAREGRIRDEIEALCKPYNIKPQFGGDPRGNTVKLMLATGEYNTWGGKECGWGVPGS